MDDLYKESISKISYYCQSAYTSINLFNDLIKSRKYSLLDNVLIKIIDDISNCIKFYLKTDMSVESVDRMNCKLQLILDGYENKDYFYMNDVLQYEVIKEIEYVFHEIQVVIENKLNHTL